MSIHQSRLDFIEFWRDDHDGTDPPYEWAICSHCRGHGTSTAHLGAYTQSDREEMGDEWFDFVDDVRAGVYDRACDHCDGSGKVREFTGAALDAWASWVMGYYDDLRTRRAESGIFD